MLESPLPSPIVHRAAPDSPIILSVPHSGREVPDWLSAKVHGGARSIHVLSDPWVDRLVEPLIAKGAAAVIARTPRAAIDCNRSADELDPKAIRDVPSPKAGSKASQGLGLIPSRGPQGRNLWITPLEPAIVDQRLESAYLPYHRALADLIDATAARHGGAILIDCHSMPPLRFKEARFVLGDRHGKSCAPWVIQRAGDALRELGWQVAYNQPYAGGEIIARHGARDENIHAIQVEIDRSAYLDPLQRVPGDGLRRVQHALDLLARRLADDMQRRLWPPMAAE